MIFWEKELFGVTYKQLTINSIIAVIVIAFGIIAGKIVNSILKKVLDRTRIEKTTAYNFFKVLIVVIKWSVYILFLNLAIKILNIPQFSYWLTAILIVIPAIVGALLLIIVGFAIAVYLKRIVEESKVESNKVLSQIFFFFIIYVFVVFALKTALISLDSKTTNTIVIILTGIIAAGIALKVFMPKISSTQLSSTLKHKVSSKKKNQK